MHLRLERNALELYSSERNLQECVFFLVYLCDYGVIIRLNPLYSLSVYGVLTSTDIFSVLVITDHVSIPKLSCCNCPCVHSCSYKNMTR